MKKSFLALVALGAFGGVAHAESSVTLYGIVDAGITYTSNLKGDSAWQATSGNESGSRWGLLGSEDLGGGNKAIFRLENGFNIDTGALGQGSRLFGRQAYVGLSNNNYGTVTLGRQYNTVQDYLAPLGISSTLTQYSTHPYDNDNLNNTFRTDNSVKYASPVFAGLQMETMYAFSNATNFAANRSWSIGANYANGPVRVATAYARLKAPALDTAGAIPSDNYYSQTYLKSATGVQTWGLGANVDVGASTFGLLYTGSLFSAASGSPFTPTAKGSLHFNNYEGSFRYKFTPALVIGLAETYTHLTQGTQSGHFLQTSLGAQYAISKRTDFYVNEFYQKSSSNLNAWIDGISSASTTSTQFVTVAGIRHKF